MKKIILLLFAVSIFILPARAEICQDFDASMNLVTVDCQTGKRIITAEERARLEKQKQQAAEEARQQRIKQAEAEQRRIEQAIEKRKQELAKKRAKQQAEQMKRPKVVYIDGKPYYLTEQPNRVNVAGISAGDWMLSIYGGAGGYLQGKSKTEYTTVDAKNVMVGSGGLSGLYFTNPYLGFGLGLEIDKAIKSNSHNGYFGSWNPSFSQWGESSSEVSLYKAMLLGRLNVNPAHSGRLYIPFGIGYGYVQDKQKNEIHRGVHESDGYSTYSYTNDAKNTASALLYFIGLGLEFDLTRTVSLGLEGRYNRFEYKGEAFAYANGLIKVNVKF